MNLSAQTKKQVADILAQHDEVRNIRLVSVNKIDFPLPTPRNPKLPLGNVSMAELWKGSPAQRNSERGRDDGR